MLLRLLRPLAPLALLAPGLAATPARGAAPAPLPYRFLVVIHDQWKDPASEVIQERNEFSLLCSLLRSWGLPFAIHRLDQQRFDAYHLLDREGRPLYGTILWNAPGAALDAHGTGTLRLLVRDHGVGLVAFSDTVENPVIAELAGLRPQGKSTTTGRLEPAGEHFITRGVEPNPPVPVVTKLHRSPWTTANQPTVSGPNVALAGATAIARSGSQPLLTVHAHPGGGRVVWLDVERSSGRLFRQEMRDILKRALVWVQGYALYAEYPRSVVLSMDDMGSSDKTYYSEWHYPSLSEETIRRHLIEPLQRHRATLGQNVNTGYLDRKSRRVLNPWRQNRVEDELDPRLRHDFASTKRGLDAGVQAGVFEIQSHGWTHMTPDLDSPPGPFWSAPATSPIVQLNWYKEFGDVVRQQEIPAIVQRLHLQRSLDDLAEDFGVRPLMLRCGGGGVSNSHAFNTMRLAASMGFALAHGERHYFLSPTLCQPLEPVTPTLAWNHAERLPAASIPWTIDGPCWIGTHDRDVALAPESFARLLDDLGPGVRYLSYAEYSAYLHAGVARAPGAALALRVTYDPHTCRHFAAQPSSWVLHLADETRAAQPRPVPEKRTIRLPAGLGPHTIAP